VIKEAIQKLVDRKDLSEEEALTTLSEIMAGEATPAQIGSFITALRMKGETIAEIVGCVKAMRAKATKITAAEPVLDTCGTGGDKKGTINISTAAAFVAAGAGVLVAKHGNRAATSGSGSADVLMALGVNVEMTPEKIEAALKEVGMTFMFAVLMHGAMKHAIGVRREIGIRTVFNILGPMTNPAGAHYQLIGVNDPTLTEVMAQVLKELGSKRVWAVHGLEGLDEISLSGKTKVTEVFDGKMRTFEIQPGDAGITPAPLSELLGGDPAHNAKILEATLRGEPGPRRDVVLLNAGAAIHVAGKARDLKEGVELARRSIDSGAALGKLEALKKFSKQ